MNDNRNITLQLAFMMGGIDWGML